MPPFNHAVRLEQRQGSVLSTFYRGAVVPYPGVDSRGNSSQQALQASDHRIFTGFLFHNRNMIAATETALKTACMTIGTSSVPVFS